MKFCIMTLLSSKKFFLPLSVHTHTQQVTNLMYEESIYTESEDADHVVCSNSELTF